MDADDDDWAWRRAIRQRPAALVVYRSVVFTLGGILIIGGLAMVPLPGPGWPVVFIGLALVASEFEPAHRLLEFGRKHLRRWNAWLRTEPWWVKGAVGLGTFAFVAVVTWTMLRVGGMPTALPLDLRVWVADHFWLPRPGA